MADIGTAYVRIAPNMTGIQRKIASGFNGLGNQAGQQFGNQFSAKAAVLAGAVAGVAQAAMQKAMSAIGNSLGDAVSRVDTLARFPTVMQNLGYSADEARQQVDRMAKSVIGLPTSLDQITNLAMRLAPVSGSLKGATDTALAFNNAVLAGGGPTYRQADAIEQFSQMLSKGKPDMMAWRTLQEAMPATLSQTAKALGITSGNTLELYNQLQSGKISFEEFTGAIVDLNSEGLPGFKSFAEQAKDSTSGIATGMQNAQTAITRGIAKILTAIGQKNVSEGIANIGKAFETALGAIATAVPPTLNVLKSIFGFIIANKDIIMPIVVGITAMVAAFKLWQAVTTAVAVAQGILNVVLAANPIGLIILAVVGLVAALTYFFTKTELGKAIMQSFFRVVSAVWEGIKTGLQVLGSFFGSVWARIKSIIGGVINWVKANWPLLLAILTGPIGIAVALIVRHWGTIKNAFSSAWNFVTGLWGKAGSFFSGIFNKIKGAFSNVANIGRDIVTGIWKGISSMGDWLKNQLINFVKDKIPGPVRKALGISSPSKVFAAIGREIPRGAAQGINATSGMVEKAVTNMADNALSAAINPIVGADATFAGRGNIAPSGGSGNNTNQTVTIGTIVLGSAGAVQEMFRQLNQDTINVSAGLTPVQGAQIL